MYEDDCCHFTKAGVHRIAEEVAEALSRHLSREPARLGDVATVTLPGDHSVIHHVPREARRARLEHRDEADWLIRPGEPDVLVAGSALGQVEKVSTQEVYTTVQGWVLPSHPGRSVRKVYVLDDEGLLISGAPDVFRKDLSGRPPPGIHGFELRFPAAWRTGVPTEVRVLAEDSRGEVGWVSAVGRRSPGQ